MKTPRLIRLWHAAYTTTALSLCLWFTAPVVITPLLTGCAAVATGSDPLVVNAERTGANAFDLVDAFLLYEKTNRAQLWALDQNIKKVADKIRAEAPPAFESYRRATIAYKRNRTIENKANLLTWQAVINQILADASAQMVRASAAR